MALTKERLENFSKGFDRIYNMQIEDLYDTNQEPAGTKVILNIPLRSIILESV